MKLSKRQLKRIIREEYSRLKRRGLLRESKDQALEMINRLESGDDLGMILDFSDLKELIAIGDKVGALEEIGYMYEGTETAGHDELLEELERLIEQM